VLVCACLLEPATCHKNHQSRQQTANSITDHLTIIPFMYLIIMLLNLIHSINLSHHYLLLLLPQFSLNLSPQNLKRAQQSWSAKSQQAAAQTGAALVSIVPSSSNGNLPSMGPWLAPRAVPGSSHGPEIATRCSPVTDRVNETRQYTRYRQRMMGAWDSNRGCHLLWGPRLRETI
jgi:hypothetical protein